MSKNDEIDKNVTDKDLKNLIKGLLQEAGELTAIMTKSRNTAIKNQEN